MRKSTLSLLFIATLALGACGSDSGGSGTDAPINPGSGLSALEASAAFLVSVIEGHSYIDYEYPLDISCDTGSAVVTEVSDPDYAEAYTVNLTDCTQGLPQANNGYFETRINARPAGTPGELLHVSYGLGNQYLDSYIADEQDAILYSGLLGTLVQRDTGQAITREVDVLFRSSSSDSGGGTTEGQLESDLNVYYADNSVELSSELVVTALGRWSACIDTHRYTVATSERWFLRPYVNGDDSELPYQGGSVTVRNATRGTAATLRFLPDGRMQVDTGSGTQIVGLSDLANAC